MNHLVAQVVVLVMGGIFLLAGCTPRARFVRKRTAFSAADPRPVNRWLPRLGLIAMGVALLYAGFFRLP